MAASSNGPFAADAAVAATRALDAKDFEAIRPCRATSSIFPFETSIAAKRMSLRPANPVIQ